jgi:hypothetical protein
MGLDWSAVETGCTGIVTVADEYGRWEMEEAPFVHSVQYLAQYSVRSQSGQGLSWCQIQQCLVRSHIYRTRHWLDRGMETISH